MSSPQRKLWVKPPTTILSPGRGDIPSPTLTNLLTRHTHAARLRGLNLNRSSVPTACAVGYWYDVGCADWTQKLYCSYFPTGEE
ncbi:MAG: hypothetical protein QOF56_1855 [Acidobacteriaceae bacterium]|nr:hypothetical protein [Acidobacteriaceae bacterium]